MPGHLHIIHLGGKLQTNLVIWLSVSCLNADNFCLYQFTVSKNFQVFIFQEYSHGEYNHGNGGKIYHSKC